MYKIQDMAYKYKFNKKAYIRKSNCMNMATLRKRLKHTNQHHV
jgi:hypothetical protein